jgi:hypothetical protein
MMGAPSTVVTSESRAVPPHGSAVPVKPVAGQKMGRTSRANLELEIRAGPTRELGAEDWGGPGSTPRQAGPPGPAPCARRRGCRMQCMGRFQVHSVCPESAERRHRRSSGAAYGHYGAGGAASRDGRRGPHCVDFVLSSSKSYGYPTRESRATIVRQPPTRPLPCPAPAHAPSSRPRSSPRRGSPLGLRGARASDGPSWSGLHLGMRCRGAGAAPQLLQAGGSVTTDGTCPPGLASGLNGQQQAPHAKKGERGSS